MAGGWGVAAFPGAALFMERDAGTTVNFLPDDDCSFPEANEAAGAYALSVDAGCFEGKIA